MKKHIRPEEGFLNPMRPRSGVERILPLPLRTTRQRPQRNRGEKTTPGPGHQRRQPQEDFPDARWDEQEAAKRTDRPCSGKSVASSGTIRQ
ncbi:hypothetical protein NDU88_011635 [Pleurodeles waltl]|uniref:Uncharacterized protein n=1 Tax=Pleurodeles waltl TaxID=8319 RepID=A0AAV7S495_PLEWA|nr:hypothetical protein NDU88_011635 [Pleurodeles waltl]